MGFHTPVEGFDTGFHTPEEGSDMGFHTPSRGFQYGLPHCSGGFRAANHSSASASQNVTIDTPRENPKDWRPQAD